MIRFLEVIDWLYNVNAIFGVNHIVLRNKIYWLDSEDDRQELWNQYKSRDEFF